ncbi:hypothetical protein Misp04_02290 [Micromonospora sp. NBRC 101691]|nr:hypothetical protein Misp04_02290 [Micromonospora sp. NBRC 101691]
MTLGVRGGERVLVSGQYVDERDLKHHVPQPAMPVLDAGRGWAPSHAGRDRRCALGYRRSQVTPSLLGCHARCVAPSSRPVNRAEQREHRPQWFGSDGTVTGKGT